MSNGPQFFETRMGMKFYDGTMPRIAEALQDIAASLKKPPVDVNHEAAVADLRALAEMVIATDPGKREGETDAAGHDRFAEWAMDATKLAVDVRDLLKDAVMSDVIVKFTAERATPHKLAEAELHFLAGPLAGMKLVGFAVWESPTPGGKRNVTFPSRKDTLNKESRTFALLRPITDAAASELVRVIVLDAFAIWEREQ